MEGFASLAVATGRVVFALAGQLTIPIRDALTGVPVALAPTADREIRHRVLMRHLMVAAHDAVCDHLAVGARLGVGFLFVVEGLHLVDELDGGFAGLVVVDVLAVVVLVDEDLVQVVG